MKLQLAGVLAFVLFTPAAGFGQDGAGLYQRHCASCHDTGASRAPARDLLQQMTPERILTALDNGVMQSLGLRRTPDERRAIATYVAGKPFGQEQPFDLEKASCKASAAAFAISGPSWSGWSPSPSNSRFQPADAAGLDAESVPRLTLKWAFAFPGDVAAFSQPTVAGGRVFVGSAGRRVYSLDAKTGCVYWVFRTDGAIRSALALGMFNNTPTLFFGDQAANVYAVDATSGRQLWRTSVDPHPAARVTGAPVLNGSRLFVPVASFEEVTGGQSDYECCTFRGSLVALDATTGREVWRTYTIPEESQPRGSNNKGVRQWGPSGGGIWSAPTLDPARRRIYVTTGDNYSLPATKTSDAIMALDMDSGKVLWTRQMTGDDAWNGACGQRDATNCPNAAAPDHDFGSSAILVDLSNGRRALVAGQKSGVVHAADPDREGEMLWQVRASEGGTLGGIEWGMAADPTTVYVPLSDVKSNLITIDPNSGRGLLALRLATGEQVWRRDPFPCPADRKGCSPAHSAAATVIPGVAFAGSLDGHLRAYATDNGRVLWDYDTVRDYTTVNGVPGRGGALNGPGPAVAGGMLFVNSGYGLIGEMPGNVLLAFSPQEQSGGR